MNYILVGYYVPASKGNSGPRCATYGLFPEEEVSENVDKCIEFVIGRGYEETIIGIIPEVSDDELVTKLKELREQIKANHDASTPLVEPQHDDLFFMED